MSPCLFFFNDTATTEIYTLSLHDALPICPAQQDRQVGRSQRYCSDGGQRDMANQRAPGQTAPRGQGEQRKADADGVNLAADRKSTRLNSSHSQISYAVFCLKKKNKALYRHRKVRMTTAILTPRTTTHAATQTKLSSIKTVGFI